MTTNANTINKQPFTVVIEGNIGSGKSSLLDFMSRKFSPSSALILDEPLEIWQNYDGVNLLDELYSDPKKWCYTFQNLVLTTLTNNHVKYSEAHVKIMGRSLFSSRFFIETNYAKGNLTSIQFQLLCDMYDVLVGNIQPNIDLLVYLREPVEVCLDRIKNRGRKEEKSVMTDYLRSLHDAHERNIIKESDNLNGVVYLNKKSAKPIPVIILDSMSSEEKQKFEFEKLYTLIQHNGFIAKAIFDYNNTL